MVFEVFRSLRRSIQLQVARRRTEDAAVVCQLTPLETAVFERCVAQGQVETAFDQIELCVGEP